MAAMLPLLRITVQHAYFNAGRNPHWRFEPVAQTKQIEQELGLRRQPEAGGMSLWRQASPERDAALAQVAGANRLQLRYAVFCDEPGLNAMTDWPNAPPVCFQMQWEDEAVHSHALADLPDMAVLAASAGKGQAAGLVQEWFLLDIDVPEAAIWQMDAASKIRQYQIGLNVPALRWKYFFSGAVAQKNLAIVDMDAGFALEAAEDSAEDSAEGTNETVVVAKVTFSPSAHPATIDGVAWVSDQAIALQQVPTRRFQLQEADISGVALGQGGRVLIKRLPNASVKKIGKETGSDGKDMLVAEIYIHQ